MFCVSGFALAEV